MAATRLMPSLRLARPFLAAYTAALRITLSCTWTYRIRSSSCTSAVPVPAHTRRHCCYTDPASRSGEVPDHRLAVERGRLPCDGLLEILAPRDLDLPKTGLRTTKSVANELCHHNSSLCADPLHTILTTRWLRREHVTL